MLLADYVLIQVDYVGGRTGCWLDKHIYIFQQRQYLFSNHASQFLGFVIYLGWNQVGSGEVDSCIVVVVFSAFSQVFRVQADAVDMGDGSRDVA